MYRVQLDQFEGPLDLLLFFIKRDEVDIHDIPIARITDQYLEAVRVLKEIDLDGAADFIYTAALLIRIKAQMLLPRSEAENDEEAEDPRRELVERLLEYVRYKEAAERLEGYYDERRRCLTPGASEKERRRLAPPPEETYRVTLFDLMGALKRALSQAEEPAPEPQHNVTREAVAVDAQKAWLVEILVASEEPRSFVRLMRGRSKPFVISTFLAVLDLVHRQNVDIVFGLGSTDFALEVCTEPVREESSQEKTRRQEDVVPHDGTSAPLPHAA